LWVFERRLGRAVTVAMQVRIFEEISAVKISKFGARKTGDPRLFPGKIPERCGRLEVSEGDRADLRRKANPIYETWGISLIVKRRRVNYVIFSEFSSDMAKLPYSEQE